MEDRALNAAFDNAQQTPGQRIFLQAFEAETAPYHNAATFLHGRLWRDQVVFDLAPVLSSTNRLLIGNMRALNPARGHGRAALEWLVALADRHGVCLSLNAVPMEGRNNPLEDLEKLMQWYEKFGFYRRKNVSMWREPGAPIKAAPEFPQPPAPGRRPG